MYIACGFHFSDVSVEIISCIDPGSGQPTQKIVKTIKDPETGQVYKMVTPLPPDQQNNVQIVCKTDPVTGKVTQQVVQTVTDTTTGETIQQPLKTSSGTYLQSRFFENLKLLRFCIMGLSFLVFQIGFL